MSIWGGVTIICAPVGCWSVSATISGPRCSPFFWTSGARKVSIYFILPTKKARTTSRTSPQRFSLGSTACSSLYGVVSFFSQATMIFWIEVHSTYFSKTILRKFRASEIEVEVIYQFWPIDSVANLCFREFQVRWLCLEFGLPRGAMNNSHGMPVQWEVGYTGCSRPWYFLRIQVGNLWYSKS